MWKSPSRTELAQMGTGPEKDAQKQWPDQGSVGSSEQMCCHCIPKALIRARWSMERGKARQSAAKRGKARQSDLAKLPAVRALRDL